MQSVIRPHHVGLTVADLESARAWYADAFGFEQQLAFELPGGARGAMLRSPDGARMELFEVRAPSAGRAGRSPTPRCRPVAWAMSPSRSTISTPSSRPRPRPAAPRCGRRARRPSPGGADGVRPRSGREPPRADRSPSNESAARMDRGPGCDHVRRRRAPAPRMCPGRARRHAVERRRARRGDADRRRLRLRRARQPVDHAGQRGSPHRPDPRARGAHPARRRRPRGRGGIRRGVLRRHHDARRFSAADEVRWRR